MRRGRSWNAWIVVLVLSVVLGACGTAPGPVAGVHPTLTYWVPSQSSKPGETERVLQAELAKFTEQTGIGVELEVIGWDTLYSRILTAAAGNSGPDLVNIGTTWAAPLQATGVFAPFDDPAMQAIGGTDRFLPATLATAGAPGQAPASIPLFSTAYGLYYNTAMFAEAGIAAPPTTWSEYVEVAQELTGPGQWGVSLVGGSVSVNAHLAFILGRQHGATLVDADGRPELTDPSLHAAFRQYLDLMAVDGVVDPSAAEWGSDEAIAAFVDGRAGMLLAQSSSRAYLESVGFTDYAVAPVPTLSPVPAGKQVVRSMVGGTNLAVFQDSPHRDEALQLVRFLTEDAQQAAMNSAFLMLPVTQAASRDPSLDAPFTDVFVETLASGAEPMPLIAEWGRLEKLLGEAFQQLWAKAATGTLTDADITASLEAADRKMVAAG